VIGRLFVVLIVVALPLGAQVTLTPSTPTAADVVTARIEVPSGCSVTTNTSVLGNVVRTDVSITGCAVGPPPFPEFEEVTFGPLPAGTYTYQVFRQLGGPPFLYAEVPVLVQPLAIPALDGAGLALFAVGVLLAALFLLRT